MLLLCKREIIYVIRTGEAEVLKVQIADEFLSIECKNFS